MAFDRKDPKIGFLVAITYGLVMLTTLIAVGGYYYMSSQMGLETGISADQVGADRTVPVGAVWVPVYPKAALSGGTSSTTVATDGDITEGEAAFRSADPPRQVLEFYRDKLSVAGYLVSDAAENATGGSMQAMRLGGRMRVQIVLDAEPGEGGTVASTGVIRTFSRGEVPPGP